MEIVLYICLYVYKNIKRIDFCFDVKSNLFKETERISYALIQEVSTL